MPFSWSRQSIRWFLEASARTDFHRNLARMIKPYLEPGDTLCDVGCGLGRLDLELAPYVASLTAIDIDSRVIKALKKEALRLGLQNFHAACADSMALNECFDIVLMSFFGRSGGGMAAYYHLCRRKLIRIVHAENQEKFYRGKHQHRQKDTISSVRKELTDQGHSFDLVVNTFEFGQPLRSWQEGELFLSHYESGASAPEIHDFLQRNLVYTGQDDFPLYLPNKKDVGIFIIRDPRQFSCLR